MMYRGFQAKHTYGFTQPLLARAGFTLIELLVTVSIISFLSSVVLVSLNNARVKARYARVQTELTQFVRASIVAQDESNNRLQDMTGKARTEQSCLGRDIRNIPATDQCYVDWVGALGAVQTNSGGTVQNLDKMTRDPWGSPYGLDENERELGPADCRFDTIRSAGPDGTFYTTDDTAYTIPPHLPCP